MAKVSLDESESFLLILESWLSHSMSIFINSEGFDMNEGSNVDDFLGDDCSVVVGGVCDVSMMMTGSCAVDGLKIPELATWICLPSGLST